MTIIMTMNIYITKANEQYLRSHSGSMSGIINELLDELRGKVSAAMYKGNPEVLTTTPPVDKLRPGASITTIIPQPTPVKKAKLGNETYQVDGVNPVTKLCKIHGLPLDSRARCLQKGCKYA